MIHFTSFVFFLLCCAVAIISSTADASRLSSLALQNPLTLKKQSHRIKNNKNNNNIAVPRFVKSTPQEQCGWPFMDQNLHHDFGGWTVAQMQYSAAGYLKETSFNVDGVYGPETTALVRRFQIATKIEADGATGPETWNAVQERLYPRSFSTSTSDVVDEAFKAVQRGLHFQGYQVNVTGKYDQLTVVALRSFQNARQDPTCKDGLQVTGYTFHLLVTGCNKPGGSFFFDAGWPQGKMPLEMLQCLKKGGFEFGTFECYVEEGPYGQFYSNCVDNINNAFAAGFESVGAYAFFQRYYNNPEAQVQWLIGNLSAAGGLDKKVSSFMLDIEGGKWMNYTQEENRNFLLGIKNAFNKLGFDNIVVYCGSEWTTYFGNDFDAFSKYPLVYAHYDDIPSFVDFYPAYGGWTKPSGKQFWDGINHESICGIQLDWDWAESPFWKK